MSKPRYIALIEQLHAQGKLPQVGTASVSHDKWCTVWKNGTCNCHPDIEVRPLNREERRSKNR